MPRIAPTTASAARLPLGLAATDCNVLSMVLTIIDRSIGLTRASVVVNAEVVPADKPISAALRAKALNSSPGGADAAPMPPNAATVPTAAGNPARAAAAPAALPVAIAGSAPPSACATSPASDCAPGLLAMARRRSSSGVA